MMLLDMLPEFWKNSKEVRDLQAGFEAAAAALMEAIADVQKQLFIDSADWGLEAWERFLGLAVAFEKNISQRREKIKSRIRGYGTSTKALIQSIADSYKHGQVEVEELPLEHAVIIRFSGKYGIPANIEDLKSAVEKVIPAHLAVYYEFKYRTWSEVSHMTWEQASAYTWADLKSSENL